MDPASPAGTTTAPELGAQHLLDAAERGADYLAQNLLPSGPFVYQRSAQTGQPITGKYNLLRHFGALWAMLDVRGYDPAIQAKAARGVHWAIENHYEQTPRGGAFRKKDWLVTGCSGLALLALDELAPEHAPAGPDDVRPGIVDFLLANQITDGALRHDFHHKIALSPITIDLSRAGVSVTAAIAPFRSDYYTGEILFGLITYLSTMADSLDRNDGSFDEGRFMRIYAAVGRAMAALMARDYGVEQRSHWMMYAIRTFAELTDRLITAVEHAEAELAREGRRNLTAWASRIAAGALAPAQGERNARSAPTACRVEAQVQFLDLLDTYVHELTDQPQLVELSGSVLRQVEEDCALLLRLQDAATGGFVGSAEDPIMQIDYTQHAISALLGAASTIGR